MHACNSILLPCAVFWRKFGMSNSVFLSVLLFFRALRATVLRCVPQHNDDEFWLGLLAPLHTLVVQICQFGLLRAILKVGEPDDIFTVLRGP